jgi:integrase
MNKSELSKQKIPQGLYRVKRGWAMRIPGKKNLVSIAGGTVSITEVLARFHQRRADALVSTTVNVTPEMSQPIIPVVQVKQSILISELKDKYLSYQSGRHENGAYAARSLQTSIDIQTAFAKYFPTKRVDGLEPGDFADFRNHLGKKSLNTINRYIVNVRAMFNWAKENYVIPDLPRWGTMFKKPSAAELRKHSNQMRAKKGEKIFTPGEISLLLNKADIPMKAMILLGLNGAFGNKDVSELPLRNIDLNAGVLDFPRVKNGIQRRVPLWNETVAAIREYLTVRPIPEPGCLDLLFLSNSGGRLVREKVTVNGGMKKVVRTDFLTVNFNSLRNRAGITGEHKGWYTLRHTFNKIGIRTGDAFSVQRISGREVQEFRVLSGYVGGETCDDTLRKVTDYVRDVCLSEWLSIGCNTPCLSGPGGSWEAGVFVATLNL